MLLNDRKIQILEAIISDYILTGEPVGSRTITKKYGFGLSSATIRNEMSDLEDMGYITQPHASAGRAPTNLGYRLYVDKMMQYRQLSDSQMKYLKDLLVQKINSIDELMAETAKIVSAMTNYTAIAVSSKTKSLKIKLLQLLPIDENSLAICLITDNKTVKNQVVNHKVMPNPNDLIKLSAVLNSQLSGKTAQDFESKAFLAELIEEIRLSPKYASLCQKILESCYKLLLEEEAANIYLSGAKNILEFPEFSNLKEAKNMLQTFEEKELLITLLGGDDDSSLQVVIGDENDITQMQNCSIIKTNMRIDNKKFGTIGILGPTRMDYSQAASVLHTIAKSLDETIRGFTSD